MSPCVWSPPRLRGENRFKGVRIGPVVVRKLSRRPGRPCPTHLIGGVTAITLDKDALHGGTHAASQADSLPSSQALK